jgi:hypothetical protein
MNKNQYVGTKICVSFECEIFGLQFVSHLNVKYLAYLYMLLHVVPTRAEPMISETHDHLSLGQEIHVALTGFYLCFK